MNKMILAAIGASLLGGTAQAVPVLDVSTWAPTDRGIAVQLGQSNTGFLGKAASLVSFTVGTTGKLSSIDLALARSTGTGNAALSIFRGNVFNPNRASSEYGPGLYTALLNLETLPQFPNSTQAATFDLLPGDIDVVAGETISFIVAGATPFSFAPTSSNAFFFYFSGTEYDNVLTYGGGGSTGIAFAPAEDNPILGDHKFRVFVDVAATSDAPEPATWGMMILGFGLVGGAIRARRRADAARAA